MGSGRALCPSLYAIYFLLFSPSLSETQISLFQITSLYGRALLVVFQVLDFICYMVLKQNFFVNIVGNLSEFLYHSYFEITAT